MFCAFSSSTRRLELRERQHSGNAVAFPILTWNSLLHWQTFNKTRLALFKIGVLVVLVDLFYHVLCALKCMSFSVFSLQAICMRTLCRWDPHFVFLTISNSIQTLLFMLCLWAPLQPLVAFFLSALNIWGHQASEWSWINGAILLTCIKGNFPHKSLRALQKCPISS